jgi:hypothetical protein
MPGEPTKDLEASVDAIAELVDGPAVTGALLPDPGEALSPDFEALAARELPTGVEAGGHEFPEGLPVPGQEGDHPELGARIFQRGMTRSALAARKIGEFFALCLLVSPVSCVASSVTASPTLFMLGMLMALGGGGLLFVQFMVMALMDLPQGDSVACFERGLAGPNGTLAFTDADQLILELTLADDEKREPIVMHAKLVKGPGALWDERSFLIGGHKVAQPYFEFFRDQVAPHLAAHHLRRVARGEDVDLGCVQVDREGLTREGTKLSWANLKDFLVDDEKITLYSRPHGAPSLQVPVKDPNAVVLTRLLEMARESNAVRAETREDRERPAGTEDLILRWRYGDPADPVRRRPTPKVAPRSDPSSEGGATPVEEAAPVEAPPPRPWSDRLRDAGVLFALSAAVYAGGVHLDAEERAWYETLVPVTATMDERYTRSVMSKKIKGHRIESVTYDVDYTYEYEGEQYRGSASVDWNPQNETATKTVRVDPEDPGTSRMSAPEDTYSFYGLILAGLFGLSGVSALRGEDPFEESDS